MLEEKVMKLEDSYSSSYSTMTKVSNVVVTNSQYIILIEHFKIA